MPLFVSSEEFERCSQNPSLLAEKADAFIRELSQQLETVKAEADAAAITAEQTCSLLEHKYVSLSSEFTSLQSQHSQLNSTLDHRLSELAQLQSVKHQIHLQAIAKDGDIERLSTEVSELHKSKRQLMELLEQKDFEISEKNATMKSYLDKIVNLTDAAALREARLSEIEADLARSHASYARISQEKELIERHNDWLNEELTAKVDSLIDLRKTFSEHEAEMSAKLADAEKRVTGTSSSLKWNKDRVSELELKLTSLQEDLCLSKEAAAAVEERFSSEISTVNKLIELYKESSDEWSKKAGELEGVIRALEIHLGQVENDYKDRLEKEVSARREIEKEAAVLKEKLEKCEEELENTRKAHELNPVPLSSFTAEIGVNSLEANDMDADNRMLVPTIPVGVSGTALAASLLRDGWSLAKMYAKYQEAVDALRHEQLGRKQSQAILERVLYEIEEKAGVILDERAEHEKLVEAYSAVNQKLQHALSEQAAVERTILEYKADLRRHERDYNIAQKEIIDLQKQVTVLLKECRDIQLRCGSVVHDHANVEIANAITFGPESDANLSFKDINGLVEQNVQLRTLVRNLSVQIEDREIELKETFDKELQKHTNEAATRVDAVLARAEEHGRMIESLHTSVAMYKKLYEEEQKLRLSCPHPQEDTSEEGSKDIMLLLEGSQEASKKAREKAFERVKHLEEELVNLRSKNSSLRSELDKLTLQASFAQEKLDRFMKEHEHQRDETNGVIARNVEFSQLIIDHQRKLRESSESLVASEERSRKLAMEVSVLKHEKEILLSSEKRASDEVRCMSERVHRLQASLDTIHSADEVREEARCVERRKLEDYVKQIEKEWAEAKKELQEERNNARTLTLDRETTMRNSMRQVEEMGKELANSLHALAAAESRAAVAEARYADLEKKVRSSEIKVVEKDSASGQSCSSIQEGVVDLHSAREEIEKLRDEAQVNRDHMLQYKSIAHVNEAALKQMETAHENFKIEADKVKKLLEEELLSLKQRVSELENECILKTKEAASAAAGQEEALLSALSEIAGLKEENAVKLSHMVVMETQLSALKDDLEKEHERWRGAHANYERQVILQSETIQELTRTSQALASLREEASESRRLADILKSENNEIKAKWEAERSMLDESKKEAENKYNELNEQNKILHSRVDALHIKLVEKECGSSGMASGSTGQDPVNDCGLQNVVNYLRRSKEIAETEISLLKKEKLRLQSQLERALKAAETAQSSLHAERANSRTLMFTEEEFKSLQLQVREMNLLRESNMQLREENRHNFEECQKLLESCQKAKIDIENLESLLRERQNEVEACRKEIEVQKIEKEDLKSRVDELLERYHNIDVQDYDHMKEDVHLMKENLTQKDAAIEEIKKLLSEKLDSISQFEKDLTSCRMELNERETRINEMLQVEASLRSDVEKQKRFIAQLKKRSENLSKEKEEITKESQVLSKQLEDSKQGKRNTGDAIGEQAMKEKEKEKDTRIQILEKTVERQREELRKERDEHKTEKTKRLKTQKTISDSYETVNQEKIKLENELEKHKHGVKMLLEEVEKLKHSRSSLPEGTSDVQILSGTILDDLAASYFLAVESFEQVSHPILSEMDAPLADTSSYIEPSSLSATMGQAAPSILPSVVPLSSAPPAKTLDERERRYPLPKTNTEIRKATRKLVRPRIGKPEESQGDIEMPDIEVGKALFHNVEVQENITGLPQSLVRKRPSAASMPELQDESAVSQETISDATAPVPKKSKGSDSPIDGADGQPVPPTQAHEIPSATRELVDDIGDSPQDLKEEVVDAEKNEVEAASVLADMPKGDHKSEVEMQGDRNDVGEEILDKQSEAVGLDDQGKAEEAQDILQPNSESGSEREEGELAPDVGDLEGGINVPNTTGSPETGEMHSDGTGGPVGSSGVDEGPIDSSTVDIGETSTPHILDDEKTNEGDMMEDIPDASDKLDDNTNQVAVDTNQVPDAGKNTGEITGTITAEVGVSKQGSPNVTVDAEPKQVSPVSKTSTTINLNERARQRAVLRQAGLVPSPTRGRARASRIRGGRVGRGQTPGDQS